MQNILWSSISAVSLDDYGIYKSKCCVLAGREVMHLDLSTGSVLTSSPTAAGPYREQTLPQYQLRKPTKNEQFSKKWKGDEGFFNISSYNVYKYVDHRITPYGQWSLK